MPYFFLRISCHFSFMPFFSPDKYYFYSNSKYVFYCTINRYFRVVDEMAIRHVYMIGRGHNFHNMFIIFDIITYCYRDKLFSIEIVLCVKISYNSFIHMIINDMKSYMRN